MALDSLIGKKIGDFEILEQIGHGGMSVVYRARQASMHREVALKVLAADESELDPSFRQRFEQEVAVIATLEHLHILPVYSHGFEGDHVYLAMRLLRGGTLADLMQREKLSLERVVELFTQFAQGLAHAHSKGVVHRDLKPSNILLDEEGNTFLTDFGLAKILGKEVDITHSGNVVGTPAYMSPEQLKGDPIDHRADIYGLGIILYQMLTGQRPFEGDSANIVSVIYKHLEKKPVTPSQHNPNISPKIDAIVLKALEKDPKRRFSSVGEMAEALQTAVGKKTSRVFPPPATSLIRRRARQSLQLAATISRHRMKLTGAFALLAIALIAGFILIQSRPTETPKVPATLIADRKGTIEDLIPTSEEVEIARAVFENGHLALLPCNMGSQYHATSTREMVEHARTYGVNSRVYDADSDKYQQSILVETARAEGATAFIICPLDNEVVPSALEALDAADYPLVLPATSLNANHHGGVVITTDNYLMGRIPGEYAGKWIRDKLEGKAKVAILDYITLEELVQRADGLEDGVLEYAPEAEIIGRFPGATREAGKASMMELLAQDIVPDVIVSINDAGTYGAIEALEEAKVPESEVAIFSIDGEPLAQLYIRDGHYLRASIEVARTEYSFAAVDAIIKQTAGATLPETIVLQPGKLITSESLAAEASS